jgi:DNA polymerase
MQTTCEAKRTRYLHVVAERKACEACPGLANASRIGAGRFDADEIGAYSRWQGNLDAELMVVGQDFADEDSFIKYRGWPGERVRTNRTLVELVAQAGIGIEPPRFGTPDDRLFFTNAVLCMKAGGMQTAIPASCFHECGRRFLVPLIRIVSPKLVVTLGAKAAEAVGRAFGLLPLPKPPAAGRMPQPVQLIGDATMLMCLHHPSPTVQNTTRSMAAQRDDWREVGQVLAAMKRIAA